MVRCEMPIAPRRVVEVADDRRDHHRADVGRQRPAERRESGAHPHAGADGGDHQHEVLEQRVRLDVLASRASRRPARRSAARPASRACRAARGRQHRVDGVEQLRPNRPAHQSARDDADHRRPTRRVWLRLPRRPLEERRERQPGCRAAVSVTEPASTPISGCSPRSHATAAPNTFCSAATSVATTIITSTSGPPR